MERVRSIANKKGITSGQLALAWVMAQGDDVVPIPGTKRRTYLEENIAAVPMSFSESEMNEIEAALPRDAAAGGRYPEAMMALVNR